MPQIELFGATISTFVRTARLTAAEKGIDYRLVEVPPQGDAVRELSPTGKIPVLRHGKVVLFETLGICSYFDSLGDTPSLFPSDPLGRARALTWCSMVIDALSQNAARNIIIPNYFPAEGGIDRARTQAGVDASRPHFAGIGKALSETPYLAGMTLSVADLFLYPIVHYLRDMPEGPILLDDNPAIGRWFERLSDRPAMEEILPLAA